MLNKKISYDEKVAQLSIESALLFSWMIPHLDVKGRIFGEISFIKGTVVPLFKNFSVKKVKNCLEEIERAGLIIRYGKNQIHIEFIGFLNNQKVDENKEALSEIPSPTPEQLQSNSRATLGKVNISKVKDNISIKLNIPYQEILEDLNTVLETSYKDSTPKTRELILARWKEGFRLEDFQKVHRKKHAEWGTDVQFRKYLRPETLYSSKFEGYLNQKEVKPHEKYYKKE